MAATANYSSKPDTFSGRHHMTELKSSSAIRADREQRHDRWLAVGVLLLFIGMIACLLTLAIMSGSSMNMDNGYEYWMMP
jgi:hypothetical protein